MAGCGEIELLKQTTIGGLSIVVIMRRMKTAEGKKTLTTKQIKIAESIRRNEFLNVLVNECLDETSETKKEN